ARLARAVAVLGDDSEVPLAAQVAGLSRAAARRPPSPRCTARRPRWPGSRWPVPGYAAVYDVVQSIDPAMATLAHEGSKRYREVFDLVYRREAAKPNEIWQADHTLLDLWVVTPSGQPDRPWLTLIEDDHSRAVAGYAVNLGAPSALTTALAFRQAIWRKALVRLARVRHP